MENASKALLIAGAILIVILLIAVGMMVYNSASGTIDKAIGSMSSTDKQIHNSQFESYCKSGLSGSDLKQLYSRVIANNAGEANIKVNISKITAAASGGKPTAAATTSTMITDTDLSTSMSNISTAAAVKYTAVATYNSGVITVIDITVQ